MENDYCFRLAKVKSSNLRNLVRCMSIFRLIFEKPYDDLTNSVTIVNITKYINVNIKTSFFTSSREIISKYVMLCS